MSEIQLKGQSNATTDTPAADYKSFFYSTTYGTFAYKDENGDSFSLVGVADSDARLSSFNILNVKQNPGSGEYSSIVSALAAITTNSASNPYLIRVGAGVFTEGVINMKPYVFVCGSGDGATILQPSNPAVSLINGYEFSQISSVLIKGVTGSGVPAIYYSAQTGATNGTFVVHDVTFGVNDTHVRCYANQAVSTVIVTDSYFGDGYQFNNGMLCDNNGSYDVASKLICSNVVVNGTSAPQPSYVFKVTGVNSKLDLNSCSIRATNITSGPAITVEDGAEFVCNGLSIEKFAKGVHMPNTGDATSIKAFGLICDQNTLDVDVDHVSASGTIFGPDDIEKITIVNSSSVHVFSRDRNIITVAKHGGDFSSVAAACDYVRNSLSPSTTNRYLIQVGPGVFSEPLINPPSFCAVTGSTIQPTVIEPAGNHHAFLIDSEAVEVSFLTINTVNSTKFAFNIENLGGGYAQLHKISTNDANGVKLTASTSESTAYLEYVDFNGDYIYGIDIAASGGFIGLVNAENYYSFPTANTTYQNRVDGATAELDIAVGGAVGIATDTAVYVSGGATARISGSYFDNSLYGVRATGGSLVIVSAVVFKDCGTGLYVDSSGSGTDLHSDASQFIDCTTNVNIDSASATGNLSGFTEREKTLINTSSTFFVSGRDQNIITVAKKGGDFDSIKDAITYVVTLSPSITNQFIISVGPGVYIEDKITGYEYISLVSDQATIQAADANDNLIVGADAFTLQGFELTGVTGSGVAAVYYNSSGNEVGSVFTLRDITFRSCDVLVEMTSATYPTTILMQACGATTGFTTGFKVTGTGGLVQLVMHGFNYQAISAPLPTKMFQVSGANTSVTMVGCLFKSSSATGTFLEIYNGGLARVVSTLIAGFNKGVYAPNTGSAPDFKIEVLAAELCTTDIQIDHVGATGYIKGSYDRTKVTIASAATTSLTYVDPTNGGLISAGSLYLGSDNAELVESLDLIESTPTMGLLTGGELSAGALFVVNVAAGAGYLRSTGFPDPVLKKHTWTSTTITLSANVDVYIYFNSSLTLTSNASYPDTTNVILLGRVVTNGTAIELIDLSPLDSLNSTNKINSYIRDVFGTYVASGCVVTENGTARKLDITAGSIYQSFNHFAPASGTAFTWTKIIRDGVGGFTLTTSQDTVPNTKYDNNSGSEATVGTNKFARHWLYQSGEGSLLKRYLVLSQAEYNSQILAEAGSAPTVPSWFKDGVIRIASIITQDGTTNVVSIIDERPIPASSASAASAASDHGSLSGLADDDHPQYLLADGTRAMTGALDMGGSAITNVGNVDGVNVSTHVSRHDFNGADPLLSQAPETIGTANSEGVSNTRVSRADHVHAHGAQTDGSLHAAAIANSTSGFMTGADKAKLDGHPTRTTYVVTGTQTVTSQTPTAVTEMTTGSLATGTYRYEFYALMQTTATGSGIGVRMSTGTASVGVCWGRWSFAQGADGVNKMYEIDQLTSTTNLVSGSAIAANTDMTATGVGTFIVSSPGTMAIQIRAENAATAMSIRAGSILVIEKVA